MKPAVLIVEDNEELADIFKEIIEDEMGWAARFITDGQAALDYLQHAIPDLVLLDLHLPRVAGMEILATIRRDARLTGTRVLVVTADAVRVQSIEPLADSILIKPVSVEQVVGKIKQLMSERGQS